MPQNGYFLMKDILTPANSGLFRVNQTDPTGPPTAISATRMTSTYGKPNAYNETITFHSSTGGTQMQSYSGDTMEGEIYWNLNDFLCVACTAPYGLYQTGINPQTNSTGFATSDFIFFVGSGATIEFDKNSYAVGETATITVTVSNDYYSALKNYNVTVQDIYGTPVFSDTTLSFTQLPSLDWESTTTYTWVEENSEGAYFGLIYADLESDDSTVLLNYASTALSSTLVISGYVFDAETTNVISGAMVNVTQGTTTDSIIAATDGNYTSTSAFSANAPTTLVSSATGYETYQHVFTPLYGGSIQINITLMPLNPNYTGIALGGIARSPPYNRTINSASVSIVNSSDGHSYLATTNSVGYYIQNDIAGASHWFDVWGSKIGFSNSSIYNKLVFGS